MGFFDFFPYTNFHNVNLDWVLQRVKEWGELVEANNTAFHNLEEANASFKAYVESYLENLDVQAQIDDKLDRMFESGELTEYLQSYISSDVSAWLEENITEPTGVIIDSSLTVSGACADAKSAGDLIRTNISNIADVSLIANTMKNKLYELLNATSIMTGNLISGFNSSHDRAALTNAAPFVYADFTPVNPYTVRSIKLNVVQTGRLTISKVLKEYAIAGDTVDRSRFIDLHTFDITTTGAQTLTLPNEITIDTDYYLAIGKYGDGCSWRYGTGGDSGFLFVKTSDMTFTHNPSSLGIDIIGSIANVNYRKVIKSIVANKKLSILGDSISTYSGYLPSGNATYYPRGEITSVDFTWWKEVINACSLTLNINNSWSGSRVTTTNGDASAGCMTRTANLGNPDIIIVYMGINDFNANVPIGAYDGHSAIPNNTTLFATAYSIMLNKILTNYQNAKVYTCTLIPEERNLTSGFPELNSNGDSLADYNETIKRISDIFNVEVLDIAKCGLTYQNMTIYNPDMLHPNKAGHALIANYIINRLDNAVNDRY